jgi:hypothetical protein
MLNGISNLRSTTRKPLLRGGAAWARARASASPNDEDALVKLARTVAQRVLAMVLVERFLRAFAKAKAQLQAKAVRTGCAALLTCFFGSKSGGW